MNILKQFISKNKMLLFVSVLFIGINTFAMLIIPFFLSELINDGILKNDGDSINATIIKMGVVLIIGTLAGFLGSYYSAKFSSKFSQDNRKKLVRNIESLTMEQIDKFGIASLVTRITNDSANAQQVMMTFFQMILPSPIMAIISIFLSFQIYPILAIIPLTSIVIFLITTWITLNRSLPNIQKIQVKMDNMTLVLREFFVGVRIIRAFDNSDREKKRTDQAFGEYAENNITINKNFSILTPVAYFLLNLAMVCLVWLGSIFVAGNNLEIGSITALVEYTTITIATLLMSALVLFQLPKGISSMNRIEQVIELKSEIFDTKEVIESNNVEKYENIKKLEYKNLDFRYKGAEKKILDNINFSVEAGQTLAIVGGTGSGKSSVIKVLLRLNNFEAGKITIDGKSIDTMPLSVLRKSISYVPQKAFIFSGKIKDNFRFANEEMSLSEMISVASTAQSMDFIDSLDEKFDSRVSQGGNNFSGGQKQRLAIARALSKEAGIYIFDDSFSALDYATDAKLRNELKSYLHDKITIIVAQRLSTIANADKIIVLDDGKIVGEGTHQRLLEENAFYRGLAATQGILKEES